MVSIPVGPYLRFTNLLTAFESSRMFVSVLRVSAMMTRYGIL